MADRNLIGHGDSVCVEAVTLDTIARSRPGKAFDVIKIDTQGAEGLIIKGGRETLTRTSPKIIMEFWPWGLRSLGTDPLRLLGQIRELGFRAEVIDEQAGALEEMEPAEIVHRCDSRDNGWGFFNLYLEKS
jgi:hypothetical protein